VWLRHRHRRHSTSMSDVRRIGLGNRCLAAIHTTARRDTPRGDRKQPPIRPGRRDGPNGPVKRGGTRNRTDQLGESDRNDRPPGSLLRFCSSRAPSSRSGEGQASPPPTRTCATAASLPRRSRTQSSGYSDHCGRGARRTRTVMGSDYVLPRRHLHAARAHLETFILEPA